MTNWQQTTTFSKCDLVILPINTDTSPTSQHTTIIKSRWAVRPACLWSCVCFWQWCCCSPEHRRWSQEAVTFPISKHVCRPSSTTLFPRLTAVEVSVDNSNATAPSSTHRPSSDTSLLPSSTNFHPYAILGFPIVKSRTNRKDRQPPPYL